MSVHRLTCRKRVVALGHELEVEVEVLDRKDEEAKIEEAQARRRRLVAHFSG